MPSVRPLQKYKKGTFGLLRAIVLKASKASKPSRVLYMRRCKIRVRCYFPGAYSNTATLTVHNTVSEGGRREDMSITLKPIHFTMLGSIADQLS